MSYTAEQVARAIADSGTYWSDMHGDHDDQSGDPDWKAAPFDVTIDGEVATVTPDGYGGGVNAGHNIWVAFKVGDQYFRKTGYHESHYGTDWDGDVEEVIPRQKTITVYDSI